MKTAFITGGAKGIGLAIAEKLKKSGYNTVIGYFSSREKALELEKQGYKTVEINVKDSSSVQAAFSFIEKNFGGVDVLINNAGIALKQKLLIDVTDGEIDDLLSVDLKGVLYCSRAAVLQMLSKGRGDIINVASVWGVEGASCEVVYSAAKGGVVALTKALAKELAFTDISVSAICPSFVLTDMNAHLKKEDVEEFLSSRGATALLYPADVADKVFDMLSSRINGEIAILECK